MKTPQLAVLLLAAAVAPSFAAVDFVADPHAVLIQARENAQKDPAVVKASFDGGVTYEPACTTIKFGPNDGPVSKTVTLSSQGTRQNCFPTGPNGGQTCIPQSVGAPSVLDVHITIENLQPLNPGEHDDFDVCLMGTLLRTDPAHTAYEYTVTRDGAADGDIVVKAGKKKS